MEPKQPDRQKELNMIRLNDYLTPKEIAQSLGVTTNTVYYWVQNGHLPSMRVGRQLRIHPDDLAKVVGPNEPKK
jgi:excisionase family DNA binding protein